MEKLKKFLEIFLNWILDSNTMLKILLIFIIIYMSDRLFVLATSIISTVIGITISILIVGGLYLLIYLLSKRKK